MKTLITGVLLVVSASALAGGTNTGTSFSHTTGHSVSDTRSYHSDKLQGNGVTIAIQGNGNSATGRIEVYTRKETSKGSGRSKTRGSFTSNSVSSSVGVLTASIGSSTGVSKTKSVGKGYKTKSSSQLKGNYASLSMGAGNGKAAGNVEAGKFNNKSGSTDVSKFNQTTNYGSTYSSVDFNY